MSGEGQLPKPCLQYSFCLSRTFSIAHFLISHKKIFKIFHKIYLIPALGQCAVNHEEFISDFFCLIYSGSL